MKNDKSEKRNKTSLKKNDIVVVTTGKDKGKQGKILGVDLEKNRVLVEGINFLTHYERPSQQNQKGGISKKEGSIAISNVMLHCSKCDRGVRIRNAKIEEGSKSRVCSKCGDII
jgi:large subunit ribosomal protein L24